MNEGEEYNFLYQNEKSSEGFLGDFCEVSNRSSKDFYGDFFLNEQNNSSSKNTLINLDDKRKEYTIKKIIVKNHFIIKEKSQINIYIERIKLLKEQLKIFLLQRKLLLKKEKKYFPKEERETKKNIKYRIFNIKKKILIIKLNYR